MDRTGLEVLAPVGVEVDADNGPPIVVKPIKLGALPAFVSVLWPVFGALLRGPVGASSQDGTVEGATTLALNELELIELYGEHGEALNRAMALATGQPLERINDLDVEQGLALLLKVWEVNGDFFVRRVLPLLAGRVAREVTASNGAGPTR